MLPNSSIASQINAAQYLDLLSIRIRGISQLEIVVREAVANSQRRGHAFFGSDRPELAAIVQDAVPIESVDGCLTYRFYWKNFVAHLVTEECVGSCGKYDDELYEGRIFRKYSKSHFLEHLSRDTGGHFNPLVHYKIICLNQLIDVVAEVYPEIEILQQFSGVTIQ